MEISEQELERLVLTRVMRLNAMIQGIVLGLVVGGIIFVATNWLVLKGGPVIGPHMGLLGQFFIGYQVTFVGSLIGFGYGFLMGFLIGFFVAKMYNLLADLRERGLFAKAPASRTVVPMKASSRIGPDNAPNEFSEEVRIRSNGQDRIRLES